MTIKNRVNTGLSQGDIVHANVIEGKKLLYAIPNDTKAIIQMDVVKWKKKQELLSFWPQLTLVPVLDEQYPCSKFILYTRSILSHIHSINMWGDLRQRIIKADIPFLPSGIG